MDWLATVLTSKNFVYIAIFVFILIFVFAWFSKKGLIRIHSKIVSVGLDERERLIIGRQIESVEAKLNGYFALMINENRGREDFVEWKCIVSKELVFDVFIKSIYMNHISADDFYCWTKVEQMWALIQQYQLSQRFTTPEFKEEIFKFCKEVFKNLVELRKYYEGKE